MSLDAAPLVSIIIPCYNAEQWIGETIEHCLVQTYPNIEIIVFDDGSTDNSAKVVQSFGDKVAYYYGENQGGSATRNRGFAHAKGDYIIFHDADDFLSPDTVEAMVSAIEGKQDTVIGIPWHYWHFDGNEWFDSGEGSTAEPPPNYDPLVGWLSGWYIVCHGILWTREILLSIGLWDEDITTNDDGELMMRALIKGVNLQLITEGRAYYRKHVYGQLSVSRVVSEKSWRSQLHVIEKIEALMREYQQVERYCVPLARNYHAMARLGVHFDVEIARQCAKKAHDLAGRQSIDGSWVHRILCTLIGVVNKEILVQRLQRLGIARLSRKRSLVYHR